MRLSCFDKEAKSKKPQLYYNTQSFFPAQLKRAGNIEAKVNIAIAKITFGFGDE
jgi:hypothetical protein